MLGVGMGVGAWQENRRNAWSFGDLDFGGLV